MSKTEARSEIHFVSALQEGFGTSRRWTRILGGKLYSFTAVLMPDGERRYSAYRYDGPKHLLGHGTFGADWTPIHLFIRIGRKDHVV